MPYQITPLVDFSSVGLVTDVPAHTLKDASWSDSLDIRCKDGSVQGVNKFVDATFTLHDTDPVISGGEAIAVTQFTPAGSADLVIAYIVKGTDNLGHVVVYNTAAGTYNDITNATVSLKFSFDDKYSPQIFVFNELLIVNPAKDAPPQFTNATVSSGSLNILPNWLNDSTGSPIVARTLKPFGSRLMAMNILEEHTTSAGDDVVLPIDILWSSHITGIASLSGVEWAASTTNTAGDAFAVETPGRILDGGQLGEYFMAYKSDAVVRVAETGDSLILSFETIFEDDGIFSSGCFASIGNSQHLLVGNYGVYIHDGQSQKQDIAKGVFQDAMFELVNPTQKDRAFCFSQTRDKEIWFSFSSTGNTGGGCDLAFVYNYADSKLHKRTLPGIRNMYETEINGNLEIYAAKAGATKLQKLSTSEYVADGWFVKEEAAYADTVSVKQIMSIYINSDDSLKIALTPTSTMGATKVYTNKSFDPATHNKVDVRATGRYLNIKVTMDGSTNPKLTTMQFEMRKSGRR